MAQDRLTGAHEMEQLHARAVELGLWVLLERPGDDPVTPTFRLSVRRSKAAIRDGRPWVRRYSMVRPMTGTNLAAAATSLRLDLESDPPEGGR